MENTCIQYTKRRLQYTSRGSRSPEEETTIPSQMKQIKVSAATYKILVNYKKDNQTFDQAINELINQCKETKDIDQQLLPIKQQLNLIMNQLQILQLSQLQQSSTKNKPVAPKLFDK